MNGWDKLKIYEGRVNIPITTGSVLEKINEVRYQLDIWLATLHKPPKDMTQALRMVELAEKGVTYEVTLRTREEGESRTILEDDDGLSNTT